MPSHIFFEKASEKDMTNMLGEIGKPVNDGFEYSSATNPHFLNIDELKNYA